MQAAEALEHAHANGVLHRDIKPANLMLDRDGKLWITDFGLARIEGDVGVTVSGDLLGTARYMAPENTTGQSTVVDQRADIYSLGVTLYELLTLQPAFPGDNRERLLADIATEDPVPPRRLDRSIPPELETIVLKSISKQPSERYGTAQELADDLRAFLDDLPIKAKPPSLAQRLAKWSRRHKPLVRSAAVILVLTTIGLAVSNVLIAQQKKEAQTAAANEAAQAEEARKQRDEAQRQKQLADENYRRARDAVDQYLTAVSENQLLDAPSLQPLRKDLLELALKYYQQFISERKDDPILRYDLAKAHWRIGRITQHIGSVEEALASYRHAIELQQAVVAQITAGQDAVAEDGQVAECQQGLAQFSHRHGCGARSVRQTDRRDRRVSHGPGDRGKACRASATTTGIPLTASAELVPTGQVVRSIGSA